MSKVGKNLLVALKLKYMSEVQSATATLHIYINNPVGIGEHPQHLEEMDKLVDTIATSQDKLDTLEKIVNL
tara:strand:- start:91 stop:303 length:213 start_codon:yes stop_codon:yes gene_type:complete